MIKSTQIQQLTQLSRTLIADIIVEEPVDLTTNKGCHAAWHQVGNCIITLAEVCNILALPANIKAIVLGREGTHLLNWFDSCGQSLKEEEIDYDQLLEPIEGIFIDGVTVPLLGTVDAATGNIKWSVQPNAYFAEEEEREAPSTPPSRNPEESGDDARL